ncbi:MAG TPA: hypothetical protein VFP21_00800 [Solirubrobacterales bacterium]|nr:hypothetical protein [Solirubrobacterales bacterium]
MEFNDSEDTDLFWGRRAVDWLFGRDEGGHFFDGAMSGIVESFGEEASIAAVAPLNLRAEVSGFFFQVEGSVKDEANWSRLIRAHEVLIMNRPSQAPSRINKYSDFHLVLDPHPIAPIPWFQAKDQWRR